MHNLTKLDYYYINRWGSYSKENLYDFLRKCEIDATNAMGMAKVLDAWHRECLAKIDKPKIIAEEVV